MAPGSGTGEVVVPCTCGELVQGMVEGVPFLVSCPIDRYSRVRVALGGDGISANPPPPKALEAAARTLALLGCKGVPFSLEVSCPLPPSKGFGTSTADVVGAIAAAAEAVGRALSPEETARLAVAVEPSDGTMFPGLALFDHRRGSRWEALGPAPPLLVAVLDFHGVVDTLEYNARLDLAGLHALESEHARALKLLRKGLQERRLELVGEAAAASARANQQLLPKPQLEAVVAFGHDCGALGVCAAHSGTALGVLFSPGEMGRAHRLLGEARGRLEGLRRAWISRMVDGGARVLVSSGLETGIVSRCPSGGE